MKLWTLQPFSRFEFLFRIKPNLHTHTSPSILKLSSHASEQSIKNSLFSITLVEVMTLENKTERSLLVGNHHLHMARREKQKRSISINAGKPVARRRVQSIAGMTKKLKAKMRLYHPWCHVITFNLFMSLAAERFSTVAAHSLRLCRSDDFVEVSRLKLAVISVNETHN